MIFQKWVKINENGWTNPFMIFVKLVKFDKKGYTNHFMILKKWVKIDKNGWTNPFMTVFFPFHPLELIKFCHSPVFSTHPEIQLKAITCTHYREFIRI